MIKLNRKAQQGDRVNFRWAGPDMVPRNLTGIAHNSMNGIIQVKLDTPKGAGIPDMIAVFAEQVTPILEDEAVIKELLRVLKLIRDQDQGCGGNLTSEKCWKSAQKLAWDTLVAFDVGN